MRSVLRKYYLLLVCTISLFSANNSLQAQNVLDQAGLTSATPAAAAYATRKLSSSYTGAAVRIRRQSDNAVADLAFDLNGNISANSLATFVSGGTGSVTLGSFAAATNAYVTIWYDQSGYGRNATQATAANQPLLVSNGVLVTSTVLNSKATLSFNGSSQFMDLPMSSSIINVAGTIAAVQVQPVLQSGFNAVVAWSLSGGTQGPGFGPLNIPGAFGLYTTWGPNNITLGPVAINQAYVLNATWSGNGSTVVQSRNGTIVNGSLGASFNYTGNALIGRDVGAFYNGNLAELIVSNTTITAANRTAMETNQNVFYINPIAAGALNFDGIKDYVRIPDNNLLDFGSSNFTIETWVNKKANSSAYNAAVLGKWNTGSSSGTNEWLLQTTSTGNDNKPSFWVESGNTIYQCNAVTPLQLNVWYHLAVVREGESLKIYVNGNLENSLAIPANTVINNNSLDLTLGAYRFSNSPIFSNMSMDELRIWSRALCQAEIQNGKDCELTASGQTGLVALYHFNQGLAMANNAGIVNTVPGAPRITSVAANSNKVTVTFTAPVSNGGSAITGYKVTSNPGGIIASGTASPIAVTGLTNGVSYTFTAVAVNAIGNSTSSLASAAVIPTGAPTSPTITTVTAGNAGATITFVAPTNNGGSPITSYVAMSTPGNFTASVTSVTPLFVTGLTNGQAYTFAIRAVNALGSSAFSAASNSVTPATVPGAPTIQSVTPAANQATIAFNPPVSNGGSAITSYTVTSNPGGKIATGTGSPLTVTGLTNGVSYTFTVKATNVKGTGVASAASAAVVINNPVAVSKRVMITYNTFLKADIDVSTGYALAANQSEYDPISLLTMVAAPTIPYTVIRPSDLHYLVTYDASTEVLTAQNYAVIDLAATTVTDRYGATQPYDANINKVYKITSDLYLIDSQDETVFLDPLTLNAVAAVGTYTMLPTPATLKLGYADANSLASNYPARSFKSNGMENTISSVTALAEKASYQVGPYSYNNATETDNIELSSNHTETLLNNVIDANSFTTNNYLPGFSSLVVESINNPAENFFGIAIENTNYQVDSYSYSNESIAEQVEFKINLTETDFNNVIDATASAAANYLPAINSLTDESGNNLTGTLNGFTLNGGSSNWVLGYATGNCTVYIPPTSPITGTTTACIGATSTLANTNQGTWSSSNTTIASVNASGLVTAIAAGTTTITFTNTCGGISTTTFTVNPLPVATIEAVGPTTVCPSSSVILQANAGTGFTYQWRKDGVNISSATSANYNATTTGSYTVVITNSNGCVSAVSNAIAVTVSDNIAPIFILTQPSITVEATSANGAAVFYTLPTAFDNCTSNVIVTAVPASGSVFAIGNTTVTVTAIDGNNNTSQTTFNISVVDIQIPTVRTANITIQLDASGAATINPMHIENGSTDNTTIANYTLDKTSFDCSNKGANTVTLTVVDAYGNRNTGTAIVTVEDKTAPQFTSSSTIITPNEMGIVTATSAAGAVVNFILPTATDNCANGVIVVATPASGSVFSIGSTIVNVIATDASGNTQQIGFVINVRGVAPSLTAPANITVNNDEGQCGATVSFAATGSLGSPAATITYTEDGQPVASGASFAIGVHTITATATNAVGSSSVNFTITVVNTDHPTITAQGPTNFCENGSVTLTASEGSSYYWNTGETTQSITVYSAGNYSASVTNAYGCPTNTNTITTTTITIPTAPEIAGVGEVCANSSTVLTSDITGGVWSSENESIATVDAQGKLTGVSEGFVQIMYAVTNESGCTSIGYFTVYVKPLPLPAVITGVTDICVGGTSRLDVTNLNGRNDDRSVWTTSNASVVTIGEFPSGIDITGIGLGTATITKTLTLYGCTAVIATAVINVRSIPIFTYVPENKTVYSITNQCNALVSYIVEATGVNTPTLTYSFNGATTGSGSGTGSGQSFNVGVTNVTITATNQCGSSNVSFTVTVTDIQDPIISAPANISVNATSAAGAMVTYVAPVGTDNCSATTVRTAGLASGSVFPIGVTTVTYTATDASGNTSSASFTVTVSGLAPVVIVPENITVNVDENTCGAAVIFAATDNTGIPASIITYTENGIPVVSGATFSTGLHTITATATNVVGSSSASFTITVIDNQAPLITAPSNISVIATSAQGAIVNYVAQVGTDNCAVTTAMTAGLASGSTFPIGVTTVTYTVTDASGNTASASFTVTVSGLAPVIVVPEAITQNNDAGQCGASVSFAATETTAIPASTIVYTENGQTIVSGHFFSVGTHTITAIATNAVGTSSANFTVTILDKQAPVALTKNITVGLSAVGGTVSITAADVNNGSSDACGIASMTVMPSSFSCANVGANTVTLTVTDNNGNVSTTTAIITVVDDKGPVPTAVLPVISGQCSVKLELVSRIHQEGDGCNSNDREKYHHHKNTRGKGHDRHEGEGDDDDDDDHENNGAIQIVAPTAMDNCSGLIKGTTTDPLVYNNQGTYIIRWKFVDARGNVTIQEQTVIVKDTQAPRPKYANLPTITGQCSVSLVNTNSSDDDGDHEGRRGDDHDGDDDHGRYNEHQMGAPWAKDNCSGWVRGTTTDPLTYSVQGTYIIHWTYNDGHGNISTQNQTVIVKDITKPKIKAPNDKTVTCGSNTAPAVMGMATATDNCSVPVITYTDVNSGNQIVRTWKATDAAGNSSTAVQTIKLSTAFSGSVVSVPTSNVYTGGAANNLYLGYGAQGTALTVTGLPSSGAPYTYSWTGVATNRLSATNTAAPVFSPTAGGVYTFTVTMTNKNGCSNTASISICVTDIRVPGSNGALVYVCHKGSGKTGGTKTLQVPVAQVASHIQSNTCGGKNDRLGSCDQNPCNSGNDRSAIDPKQLEEPIEVKPELKAAPVVVEELKVVVMPNPTTTYFTIRLESKDKAPVNLRVMDGSGRVIDAKQQMEPNSSFQMGHGYSSGTYYAEFIQGNKRKVIQLIKGRG